MSSVAKISVIDTLPAWASSLVTAFLSLFIPFIVAGIGFLLDSSNQRISESSTFIDLIGYLLTGIFVAVLCFFICRAHPKSVWSTPIISNGMTILMAGNYLTGNLQLYELLLTLGIGWMLSIIASILGRHIGIKTLTKDKIN